MEEGIILRSSWSWSWNLNLNLKHSILSTMNNNRRRRIYNSLPNLRCRCRCRSSLPDFQDYAKPKRLLPSTEVKRFTNESPEKIILNLQSDGLQSLYKILLRTSSFYDSGLSDLNGGLLICVIDENGDSVLQRIPAILPHDGVVHFQRGSTDEFMFWGPKLEKIKAVWISLESGIWRLGGVNLTIIRACNHLAGGNENGCFYCIVRYNFEVEDVLIGEGSDMTIAELCPSLVTEYSGTDALLYVDTNVKQDETLAEKGITKEESMKEYADLKYSLLLYDAMLIFAGSSVLSFTSDENTALAFFAGGIGGFLYLLLLQKSVDDLPVPESISVNEGNNFRVFGLKGGLLVLVFAFGIAVLMIRSNTLNIETVLGPREVVIGMMGFLVCKVSVILAAFKPISIDNN